MPNTHCLPTGSLGTSEIPICNVTTGNVSVLTPSGGLGHGNVRGIVVFGHGLAVGPTAAPVPIPPDSSGAAGDLFITTFANTLVADGWVFAQPAYIEDSDGVKPPLSIYNDVNADAGHGSRYLNNTTIRWWDHVLRWVQATYPAGFPIVFFGSSWGAWHALQIAANRQSTIIAFGGHEPVTVYSNISVAFLPASSGFNIAALNSTGLDATVSMLASVSIPGIIGFGTMDEAVGYSGTTTVAVGSNGVAASAVTTLNVAASTGFVPGASATVTGLTGGTGIAVYSFTGTGTGTLTGCTLQSGSGTLATNNPVTQSQTSAIIAASPANVTSHSTADVHEFTLADANFYAGTWFVNTVDPLAPKTF